MKEDLDKLCLVQVAGDFVERQEGRTGLPSHREHQIKRDGAGNVHWFKAMRVCGENHKIEGIDYQATYSSTSRFGCVQLALTITAQYDLKIRQMDVCTALV